MALLKTENLSFTYPSADYKAIDNINIEINQGELVLLMGRSGSGKSTLLSLINKDIAPFGDIQGEITVNSDIAYVPQNAEATFVGETVRGELAFPLENKKLDNSEIAVRIGEIASFFNLADCLDKPLDSLSGGEKAAVAIASAMINNASLLLLDEPFSQLDVKACHQLSSLLKRVNEELAVTIIIATHTSQPVIEICDRIIILDEGKMIANDTPTALSMNDELLPYYPLCTSLFDERPLTVKQAKTCNKRFKEKEYTTDTAEKNKAVMLKNIYFSYGKRDRDILSSLNFNANEGEIHFIIGANGSGKTTLLKLIAGISRPYSGRVKVNGRVSYIPQNVRYLFSENTVLEEVGQEEAERYYLSRYLDRHPYDLSGGELQRLAFAKVLGQDSDIILIDEPTKSLDTFSVNELKETLKALKSQGKTIIIVSHDLDFAGDIADRISFLSDGIITITDTRQAVLSKLTFYTTQVRRITSDYLDYAVSQEDLI